MKKILTVVGLLISLSLADAQNPCVFKYGHNEADSIKCIEEITFCNAFYKQKNYKDAYSHWQYIVTQCPCSWNGAFVYAQTILDALIKDCGKDSSLKEQRERYIDTLLWSYTVRSTYFPDKYTKGNGLGFKAYNLIRYRSMSSGDFETAFNLFNQSIDLEKESTLPNIWDVYFKTAEVMTEIKRDTSLIIEAYERAAEYIDVAINNSYKQYEKLLLYLDNLDSAFKLNHIKKIEYYNRMQSLQEDTLHQMKLVENYKKTLSNIENIFTPYAPCSVLEQVYSRKLDANKNDLAIIKKIVLTMSKDSECIFSTVMMDALEIFHKAMPSAQSAFLMGNFSFKRGEVDNAIAYLQQAINMFETNEQKVKSYYMLALAYQLKNNFSEARNISYKILQIKPNFGKAYILIGDLYAASASRCSDLPYATSWVAADKYNKAAAVDPSVAEEAVFKRSKLIYPVLTDATMRGLHDGDIYTIGCWIGEATTVRNLR